MHSISVVMAVYQDPEHVRRTVESVLAQQGVDLELLIVSDGACDEVLELLNEYSDDQRVKVVGQNNMGLTRALINGCNQAQHPFVARIDAGDEMLESRLELQATALAADSTIGFVTSWVSVKTEEGYRLYDLKPSLAELSTGVSATNQEAMQTPFHASVMFTKSAYDKAGGYRPEFYFTQDLDLWSRMITVSTMHVIPQILTDGLFSVRGISARHVKTQQRLSSLVAQANLLRQNGQSDSFVLQAAEQLRPKQEGKAQGQIKSIADDDDFDGLYFIGKVLFDNKSSHSKEYLKRAINAKPLNLKARFYFLLSMGIK